MTVYVDVLFALNFFITYLLLLLTKALAKRETKTLRLILSAFLGGLYSLVIFAESLMWLVSLFGKFFVSVILVLVAFGFKRGAVFLKTLLIFYFSNLVFIGVIIGVWLIFKPEGVAINNGTAYFDIPVRILILSALLAYAVSFAVIKISNRTLSKHDIYNLKIFKDGSEYNLLAFADSGNRLREPFSDYPVIIADSSALTAECDRFIPYNTVGGEGMLKAFKPDRVVISCGKTKVESSEVYIALSEVKGKDFSAILNAELLNI